MGANEKRQPKPFGNIEQEYWKTLEFTARTQSASCELYQREIPLLYQKARYFIALFTRNGYIAEGAEDGLRQVLLSYEDYKKLRSQQEHKIYFGKAKK